jgi:hypothetical protein
MKATAGLRQDANASVGIGRDDVDRGMFPTRTRAGALAGLLLAGLSPLGAQSVGTRDTIPASGIKVAASFSPDHHVPVRAPIELTFDRFPGRNEGTIAVMIGTADVTPLLERRGMRLVFRSSAMRLPSGDSEVAVYLVSGDAWNELARFPLRVLTPLGFTSASAKPSLSMNNSGQLAERSVPEATVSDAPGFDDLRFTGGVQTSHERAGWTFETQENAIGVTNRRQALRFGERGTEAPAVDLSDYVVTARRDRLKLTLGNTTLGANRHLISGFGSRGATATIGGSAFEFSLGALGGSSIVGWDDLLGFTRPEHRISAGALAIELRPQRPGALHIDVTAMHGSLLPRTGFTQNALTDAERSTGAGVQFTASTPSQHMRFSAGFARSRFVNPADALLSGGDSTVPVVPVTKTARYVESTWQVLQNTRLARVPVNLSTGYRHERVDPLYRSVGTFASADVHRHSFETTGSLGAVSFQATHNRSHDNLAGIASILRTVSRSTVGQTAVPLATLLRSLGSGAFWPVVSYSISRTHQFGDGVPVNSGFTAANVPNLVATSHDASAAWQGERWRANYRFNHSLQDNRQPGLEDVDLGATVHAAGVSLTLIPSVEIGVELSAETQRDASRDQRNATERMGVRVGWRPFASTTLAGDFSISRADDDPFTQRNGNDETRLELSQSIARIGRTRGQLFVRYGRQRGSTLRLVELDPFRERNRRATWNVTSGLNLQLF